MERQPLSEQIVFESSAPYVWLHSRVQSVSEHSFFEFSTPYVAFWLAGLSWTNEGMFCRTRCLAPRFLELNLLIS